MSEKKEYIERGALLKAFGCENAVKYGNKNAEQQHKSYSSMMLYEIADEIYDAPAADVEPVVRGEWIEHYDECECPVCGETWNYCDNDTERFDCCPKCGARLVEHGKERER